MTLALRYLTMNELEAGLDEIRQSPKDNGILELIVCRPAIGEREIVADGQLNLVDGLVGDNWKTRGSSSMPDKSSNPDMQLNIMNSRAIALIAQEKNRWQLAGDQLFVDFDLSSANLPAGSLLSIGSAVIEVTPQPHTGCKKFVERFGLDAMKFVNSSLGRELCLRGINARVVQAGAIRRGETVKKI
jgi:hypothetical protein